MATTSDTDERDEPRPTLLERLSAFLTREPEDRGELLDLLRGAFERRLLDADALSMIEGVLNVSEMTVRDVMIPRSQMDCVSIDDGPGVHPDGHRDQALALPGRRREQGRRRRHPARKGPLHYRNPGGFSVRDTLRPAVFDPSRSASTCCCASFAATAITSRSSSTSTAACPAW
jgi:magnesium and cobalt transporter